MQFSVIFFTKIYCFTDPRRPRGRFIRVGRFFFRPAPGSPGMITVRTLPTDTEQLPGYGTVHFVVQHPPSYV